MKKVILSMFTITCGFMLFISNLSAISKIPDTMPSHTLIKYISSDEYIVLNGKEKDMQSYNENDYVEVQNDYNFNECLSSNKTIVETYPLPKKDMFVQYGSDGQVNKIYSPKNVEIKYNINLVDSKEFKLPQTRGSLTDPTWNTVAKWGSYPNYLYKQLTHPDFYTYKGYGRATTYTGSEGDHKNKLKKGDVATKLAYDNIRSGTKVNVTAKKKGTNTLYSKDMIKNDVGGMPNAIIDIWNSGVEYWGYKYSKNLSLGGVTILHD